MRFIIICLTLVNLFSQELSQKALEQIKLISNELEQKTGIKTSVLVERKVNLNEIIKDKNYAILVLSLDDKKLDVINDLDLDFSSVTKYYYLKYGFLPTQGAILPLLSQDKGKDLLNAAVLNGFSELASVIAKSKNVSLENTFNNSNDSLINFFRLIFYTFIIFVIFILIKRKIRKKNES